MTSSMREFVKGLASAAGELFLEDNNDPKLEEIVTKYTKGLALPSIGQILPARQVTILGKILNEDGHVVCPLAEQYYRKFGRRVPEIEADIMRCLPVGPGKKIVGIRRIIGKPDEDRMFLTWMRLIHGRGMSQAASAGVKIDQAVRNGSIGGFQGRELIEANRHLALIAMPEFPVLEAIAS